MGLNTLLSYSVLPCNILVKHAGNVKSDKNRIPLSHVVFNQQRYSPLNSSEFFLMEQPHLSRPTETLENKNVEKASNEIIPAHQVPYSFKCQN